MLWSSPPSSFMGLPRLLAWADLDPAAFLLLTSEDRMTLCGGAVLCAVGVQRQPGLQHLPRCDNQKSHQAESQCRDPGMGILPPMGRRQDGVQAALGQASLEEVRSST